MPDYVGWLVERADSGFVAGLRRAVAYVRFDPLTIDYIAQLEPDKPSYRLNDGKAHPTGSVYFDTMDNDEQDARAGAVRRLTLRVRPHFCIRVGTAANVGVGEEFKLGTFTYTNGF